ncbi:hypothetical protein V5O48_017940 [Marasmius crinis-equi]|uniref:Uncharacterized protein n=1 Tax=Marasmius crinis-equi TaxID=585013 RepID=A0ABR3EMJ3_9AGAR
MTAITTPDRFENLNDSDSVALEHETNDGHTEDVYASLPLLFGEDRTDTPEPASASTSFWSNLASPFSWTITGATDIPVMMF